MMIRFHEVLSGPPGVQTKTTTTENHIISKQVKHKITTFEKLDGRNKTNENNYQSG